MQKETFLLVFFSLVRKEREGQKEEGIPLLNSFCRLAATSANIASEPSHYSLATATGSKRSSADSDLLLCHVGLWRTSRFRFGCASMREHSEMRFVSAIHRSNTSSVAVNRATFCPCLGDADRVCFANRSISHWRRLAKIPASVSAFTLFTPANPIMRACRQCVHESARLFRAICSHAWYS